MSCTVTGEDATTQLASKGKSSLQLMVQIGTNNYSGQAFISTFWAVLHTSAESTCISTGYFPAILGTPGMLVIITEGGAQGDSPVLKSIVACLLEITSLDYNDHCLNEHALFINGIFAGAKSLYKRGVARPV